MVQDILYFTIGTITMFMYASYKAQNVRYGAKDEIQTNTKHKLDSKRRYEEEGKGK